MEGYPSKAWREEVGFLQRVCCFMMKVVGGEQSNLSGNAMRCKQALSSATNKDKPACPAKDDGGYVHVHGHGSGWPCRQGRHVSEVVMEWMPLVAKLVSCLPSLISTCPSHSMPSPI